MAIANTGDEKKGRSHILPLPPACALTWEIGVDAEYGTPSLRAVWAYRQVVYGYEIRMRPERYGRHSDEGRLKWLRRVRTGTETKEQWISAQPAQRVKQASMVHDLDAAFGWWLQEHGWQRRDPLHRSFGGIWSGQWVAPGTPSDEDLRAAEWRKQDGVPWA